MNRTKQNFSVNHNKMLSEMLTKEGNVSEAFRAFHNYSIRNQFLACYQMKMRNMDIQPINSFTGWNKLNRHVNKGEKAIYLWQPFTINTKAVDEKTGEVVEDKKVVFKFKPSWFALQQTSGADLKSVEDAVLGDFNFDNVYKTFKIKIINFEHINGNVQGFARTGEKELAINPLAEDLEMTILHEVAHIVLDHSNVDFGKEIKELEAEAVAYIVGSIAGVDKKQLERGRGYIQSWFKANEIPEKNSTRIMSAANKIIKAGLGK